MEDKKISENFSLSEFDNIYPEVDLLMLLQEARTKFASPVVITNASRTVKDHIRIYQEIYKDKWLEKIPWGSRHLPAYGKGLRAVDFQIKKGGDNYYSGDEISDFIRDLSKQKEINIGLGIGKQFVHLDVDREISAEWTYNY